MQTNQIYHADCMVGMSQIADSSIDLILCDLPYGVLKTKGNPHTAWDIPLPLPELWAHYKRIAKPNAAIILTATQPFATALINSNPKSFKYELIWCKSRASGFLNARKMPNRSHENVLVFYDQPPAYTPKKYLLKEVFKKRFIAKVKSGKTFNVNQREDYLYVDDGYRFPDTLLEFDSPFRPDMHPTEKPIDLFRWLISTYSKPGDLVLDNCMGSGTTAIAAVLEGRNFIGFEMDEKYVRMAQERLLDLGTKKLLKLV